MPKAKGRPKGSKNQPTLFETRKGRATFLSIPKESLGAIHRVARESGVHPQRVLEDWLIAGEYAFGNVYDQVAEYRKKVLSGINKRKENVISERSPEALPATPTGPANGEVERVAMGSGVSQVQAGDTGEGSGDAPIRPGLRPEDNPAFGSPGIHDDVIGVDVPQITHFETPETEEAFPEESPEELPEPVPPGEDDVPF